MGEHGSPPRHFSHSGRTFRIILGSDALQDPTLRTALDTLWADAHLVETREISQPGQAVELARQAARDEYVDTVIAVGGDGTLSEVINGLMDVDPTRDLSVGTLPLGTANDFATANGIPTDDPVAALRVAAKETPARIDVIRVDGRFCVNVASAGAAADVTVQTPDAWKQVLGKFAYFLSGLTQLPSAEATLVRLEGPDFHWEGHVLTLAVANSRRAGGGAQVAPRALLNDGLLDLLVIPDMSLVELTPVVIDLLSETPRLENERIVYRQTPWLAVTATSNLRVNLDGEPIEGREFRFEIVPRRLLFHLPAAAPLLQPASQAEATVRE
jgi:lipid kinase YegS